MRILHTICTFFITGLVAAAGTGCAAITPGAGYKEAAETVQERSETESQATIIENTVDGRQQGLPTQYRITYEIENGDGTVSLVTMARDEAGNLYYQDEDQELWFMPQRGGYVQAEPDQDGTLTAVSENRILKENRVHQATELFWDCAETSDKLIAPGFTHAGTVNVADRTCDLYTTPFTEFKGALTENFVLQTFITQFLTG